MSKKKTHKALPVPLPPEEADRYIKDIYYSEFGAWYHICLYTLKGFFGRKNQKYIDARTKSAAATAIRAERRSLPEKERIARDKNDEILGKLYWKGQRMVGTFSLKQQGFDRSAPSTVHESVFGKNIVFYKDFGCYFNDKASAVRIFRKSSDFQLYHNFQGDIFGLKK